MSRLYSTNLESSSVPQAEVAQAYNKTARIPSRLMFLSFIKINSKQRSFYFFTCIF